MGKKDQDRAKESESEARKNSGEPAGEQTVQTGGWDDNVKVRLRTFNGPAGADDLLRIAMSKEAYASLVGHAKETLHREICGVLLGDLCEDDYGRFIQIEQIIRGGAAKGGGTHVTFTQETWNDIHAAKEEKFPRLTIVGWYHSHPGFGVEFSDMDLFIQKNFFGGPGQIAFVTDPLGGEEAIVGNIDGDIKSVGRFWVDGRERRCYVPRDKKAPADGTTAGASGGSSDSSKQLDDLRDRVRQLTEAVEQQRRTFYNFLFFLGAVISISFLLWAGYGIWRNYQRPILPPEDLSAEWTVPVPLVAKDGQSLMMVTLAAKGWKVSPEIEDALWKNLAAKHKEEYEAMIKELAAAATRAGVSPDTAPATAPASAPATNKAP